MKASINGLCKGFTLIELLVTIAILGLLASLLIPAVEKAKRQAHRAACLSQLRQQGLAWQLYVDDNNDRFPDARDLKSKLPGGYKPWATWPKSDPRAGWAPSILNRLVSAPNVWSCPSVTHSRLAEASQVTQMSSDSANAVRVQYWMWRFDRLDDPIPDDNFWGRPLSDCVGSLRRSHNPTVGMPSSPADVELIVDVYFPSTVPGISADLSGRSAHYGGRNRSMLDGSAAFLRDPRTRQ